MITGYKANNGKLYTFFSDRIHTPDPSATFIEGNPCINCGNTTRYTINNCCVFCTRERGRKRIKHGS